MTRIDWECHNKRPFEAGVDRGVFYPENAPGVPWNGLTSVSENANVEAPTPIYLDGIKVFDMPTPREFTATLSCYTYPDEFIEYDGFEGIAEGMFFGERMPRTFGLCYRTLIGEEGHYKLHFLYGMTATPAATTRNTLAAYPEATTLSWNLQGIPQLATSKRPTTYAYLDSRLIDEGLLRHLESMIYGSESYEPQLPTPEQLLFYAGDVLPVMVSMLSNGEYGLWSPSYYLSTEEGEWTFTGPTGTLNNNGTFQIESESLEEFDEAIKME